MTEVETTWKRLSAVDVNEHKRTKGNFDYLSWTYAIQYVKETGMSFSWTLLPDVFFPDGTMEVRVEVTIEGQSHVMWLAVMDHRNAAIKNPDAAAINKARMRCLVKGIAAHGMGFYIYAGEDLPATPNELYEDMLAKIAIDPLKAVSYYKQQPEATQADIYNSAPAGKKVEFKKQLSELEKNLHLMIDDCVDLIRQGLDQGDDAQVFETYTELDEYEQYLVRARLTADEKEAAKQVVTTIRESSNG